METMLIQLTNKKAKKLLYELEELNLIKVLNNNTSPNQKLSEKYAGKLPSDIADNLQHYITQSRNEWNNRNI
jgi:hypothetical protein